MSPHFLTPSRSHARTARSVLSRLADRIRGHGPVPEMAGPYEYHADGLDIKDALDKLSDKDDPFPGYDRDAWWRDGRDRPREQSHESETWWGMTRMDYPPAHYRPYVKDPLTEVLPPLPDPGPEADLGGCPIWREAVRFDLVRRAQAQGVRRDGPWHERYARAWAACAAEAEDAARDAAAAPLPDFDLRRWDGAASDVVAGALAKVDAEWAARGGAVTPSVPCPEYAGRHSGGSEAA